MAIVDKEHILKLVRRFNHVENIQEQWKFIKIELEEEQIRTIELWLNNTMGNDEAKERIKSIRWLINFIQKSVTQGEIALNNLKEGG